MIINNPHIPRINDIIKPKFNEDKFIETYDKYKNPRQNSNIEQFRQIYHDLIKENYRFLSFSIKDSNLCCCHVDEESLGWIVPIQCLKRVKI